MPIFKTDFISRYYILCTSVRGGENELERCQDIYLFVPSGTKDLCALSKKLLILPIQKKT